MYFIFVILMIILKEAASYYSSQQSKGEIKPNHYQKQKETNTGIFYNEERNSKHQYKQRCNAEEGCNNRKLVYPYVPNREPNKLQWNKRSKKDDSRRSKSGELVEWINKEVEHVKIPDSINYHEPKVFQIEVDHLSGRKERSGYRTIAYEQVNQSVTKQKKYKIIYKRLESDQQVYSEISEGENDNGSEQGGTYSEKPVAKVKYVTKQHRRFITLPSYTEFGSAVEDTPPIFVRVKKRTKANLQRSNVQPVQLAELKDNSVHGDSLDIDLLDTINNKRKQKRKKGNEKVLKFLQHRPIDRQRKEVYINSQIEEISDVSNENVKQNDRLEVDDHQLKMYLNNDEIHKISGMKPQEIHEKPSFNNEWDEKQNTQAHNITPAIGATLVYVKMDDNFNEKSNIDTQSSVLNKENSSKAQSVERSNKQQIISKPEQQDGSEVITLLKPLLVEVLDELKDVKQNTNDENINNKMQSMQRVVNEKIELIKPTLLEVLNELKENKKLMKQEAQAPQSSPIDIIKPMLVGVLDEIKKSNKKTQEALMEIKNDKKQTSRNVNRNIEEKFPKKLVYTKQKTGSDQVEYDSTKEDNVNTVESDKSDKSQEESQKDFKSSKMTKMSKLHENELKKKYFKDKKTADHVDKKHSNKNKTKPINKQTNKCDNLNFRKRTKSNILSSNIFNASEILSNPIKQQMVKDVIKVIAKQKLVSMISELLADRFIDKLRKERSRNETQIMYSSVTNFLETERAKDVFNVVNGATTTDLPVSVQRFEIFLG